MIAFRVGYEDAEILAAHFHPPNAMAPHAFSDLSQYEAWARIMRYGEVSDPIRITTLPRGARILIQHSRDRFATRRAVDAEAIASRLAVGNAVTNDGLGASSRSSKSLIASSASARSVTEGLGEMRLKTMKARRPELKPLAIFTSSFTRLRVQTSNCEVTDPLSCWACAVVERRGFNRAAVALANKLARIAWALLAHDRTFQSKGANP